MSTFINIDELFTVVGEFGLFQIGVVGILCILSLPTGYLDVATYFTAYNPSWRCIDNSSVCIFQGELPSTNNNRCYVPRDEWTYVKDKDFSVVTQFDLSCDREYLVYLATSMYFIGYLPGSLFVGWFSDRFGRSKTIIPFTILTITVNFLSAYSPTFWMFAFMRLLLGFFSAGTVSIFVIMASEVVGPRFRPLSCISVWFFYTVSFVLLGVVAMKTSSWKQLVVYLSAPFYALIPFLCIVPESIRWLYIKKDMAKIHKMIKRISWLNGKKNDDLINVQCPTKPTVKTSPLLLFKTKRMAMQTFLLSFVWTSSSIIYFGVTLASDDFNENIYLSFILSSVVEFPADIAAIILSMRFGRKYTSIVPLLVAGTFLLSVICISPNEKSQAKRNLKLFFGICGKFFITASYDNFYTWTTELYPTIIRGEGMSLSVVSSSIGGILAPWISKWLGNYRWYLPFATMGALCFLSAFLLTFLRETKNEATAEFLDSGDRVEYEAIRNQSS